MTSRNPHCLMFLCRTLLLSALAGTVMGTSWRLSSLSPQTPLLSARSNVLVVQKDSTSSVPCGVRGSNAARSSLAYSLASHPLLEGSSSGSGLHGAVPDKPDDNEEPAGSVAEGNDPPLVTTKNDRQDDDLSSDKPIARGGHAAAATSTRVKSSLPYVEPNSTTVGSGKSDAKLGTTSSAIAGKARRNKKKKKEVDGSAAVYAKKLKNRNNLNLRRKVMHASFGLFFATLNTLIPKSRFVPGMTLLTSATLVMELLRYKKGFGWMNDALHFTLGSSLRKHEMQGKFTGSFYFFLGVTVTSALYPTTCASLGICQLALADPSASYFGRQTRHVYWSRIENGLWGFGRNKGMLGFLGGALFCFPFNYRVLSLSTGRMGQALPGGNGAVVTASLLLGLAGALADLAVPTPALTLPRKILGIPVPPFHVDDNFVVPIFSGFACTKVFEYLKWSADLEFAKFILF